MRKEEIAEMKKIKFMNKDRNGKRCECGFMEIKNQTEDSADLFFYGDIASETWQSSWYEDDMAPGDVKEFLDNLDGVSSINIHINSGGGSVFGGIAIYNMLKRNSAQKTVYIDGIAASIASVIAMAGDRIIVPANATMMIHKPSNSYFFTSKNADELRKDADILDRCQTAIIQTYMTKAKVSEDEINQKVNEESWLVGDEIAELFDVEVEESNSAAAYAGSFFTDSYKNVPQNVCEKKMAVPETASWEEIEKAIARAVQTGIKDGLDRENKKKELLASLEQYGERD